MTTDSNNSHSLVHISGASIVNTHIQDPGNQMNSLSLTRTSTAVIPSRLCNHVRVSENAGDADQRPDSH